MASNEDIMENNHTFVMLQNLSVNSHLSVISGIFPQYLCFIAGSKSKNNLRGYVAIMGTL